jgi:hypothetical protein
VIKFCFEVGKTALEHEVLRTAFVGSAMERTQTFGGFLNSNLGGEFD